MKRTKKTEFEAGRQSGLLHDYNDRLCRDNERKMNHALSDKTTPVLIRVYWEGYKQGMPVIDVQVMVNGVPTTIKSNQKVVKNLMTQKEVVIDKDTPLCCDPSSETYWSM
jgi:hypothetical protein